MQAIKVKQHTVLYALAIALLPCGSVNAQTTNTIIPADSIISHVDSSWQRLLLSAVEANTSIVKGGWKMQNLSATPASPQVPPKLGQSAMSLRGEAEIAGAKGDFSIFEGVPGNSKLLGMWVYLVPDANVDKLGFQIQDAEGESLLATLPATWQGWKWVEIDLQAMTQAYEQADKNKKVDAPLKNVHIAWFAKAAGQSSLTIDALVAVTELKDALARVDVQFSGAAWGETNSPLAAQQMVVTNYGNEPRTAKVEYVVQRDSALFSATPPDPVYGSDHALGAKSWTEANGKELETGSLSDGKDWTNAALPWGKHKEAIQYIDLGQERTVSRLAYLSGDANWAWKVEISASGDGKTYQPVPGLQELDMHAKWGYNHVPVALPFKARYLRLRHHNAGQEVNAIAMPSTLAVYDGVADEKWEMPVVGEPITRGTLSQTVGGRSFGTLNVTDNKPLAPGAYLIAARVQDGQRTQMLYRHFMVMPAPLKTVSAASRFGLNTSNYLLAPLNRRLGIGWVRFENLKWQMVSPRAGEYRFDGTVGPWHVPHDQIMNAYRAHGLNVLPYLFQTPDYATSAPATVTKNQHSYPPKDNTLMADFVFQTVARYGSKKYQPEALKTPDKKSGLNLINTYEIWNEPNLTAPDWGPWVGTTAEYNEMFRAAAEAVKRADPNARVTNGGFAGIDIETVNTLLTPYADGKKPLDFVDVLNVHYYSGRVAPEIATNDPNAVRSGEGKGARTYEDDLHRLMSWRDKHKPGLPIWLTETGYDSAGSFGTNEQIQAARLPRVVMMALAAGMDKVLVYREAGSTPSMHAASGVLRDDETLKPSWFTYATLIRELDGVTAKALRLPYPDSNVRLYAWTRGTETILSAWAIEGTTNLNLSLGNSTVTDAFGHTRGANIAGQLPLSIFPVYIKKISNLTPAKTLIQEAQRNETAARQEQARLAKLRAYLFDFGTKDKVGTIDIGDTRTFTPVVGKDVYDEQKGYGFVPAGGQDNDAAWIIDPLDRDSTRMFKDNSFRVRVPPGRYQLRIGISPFSTAQLTVKGANDGDKTFPITKDGPVLTTEIEAGTQPLSITVDNYADIRWLTLVEHSNSPLKK